MPLLPPIQARKPVLENNVSIVYSQPPSMLCGSCGSGTLMHLVISLSFTLASSMLKNYGQEGCTTTWHTVRTACPYKLVQSAPPPVLQTSHHDLSGLLISSTTKRRTKTKTKYFEGYLEFLAVFQNFNTFMY
jgi:hypothetical protein